MGLNAKTDRMTVSNKVTQVCDTRMPPEDLMRLLLVFGEL